MPHWLLPALALVVSPLLTALWIRRARRLLVLDTPERRRLHDLPTPRGGGIGPVAAVLLVCVLRPQALAGYAWPVGIGLLSVATVSWIDDHRPLSIRLRLGIHVLAAAMLAVAHIATTGASPAHWTELFITIMLLSTASMNLHNFMDGSDAHLTSQTVVVFSVLAVLAHCHDAGTLDMLFLASAVACLAFLPFNWPRAKVFLGDVGSISFGFLIAAFSLIAIDRGLIGWGGALVLSSGFMIDASATLVGRMRRTRHWLKPHRDHLYQWLRRRGWSAARVVAVYQGWNLLVVVPTLWLLDDSRHLPILEFMLTFAVYGLGLIVWIAARGALRRAHRAQ